MAVAPHSLWGVTRSDPRSPVHPQRRLAAVPPSAPFRKQGLVFPDLETLTQAGLSGGDSQKKKPLSILRQSRFC